MSDFAFAAVIGIVVFVFGAIGPPSSADLAGAFHHRRAPKDLIGAMAGLLTLLSALVLGRLIWTAYGVYPSQNVATRRSRPRSCNSISPWPIMGQMHAPGTRNCGRTSPASWQVWGEDRGAEEFVAENFTAAMDSCATRRVGFKL